jgi:serine/threonine protein kinase
LKAAAAYEIPRGTTLGKYEILRKLATGGMAEIYLACVRGQADFEKTVVLKRILPHFAADPKFVQMFLDEARLAATLRHPNIADVYDIDEVNGTLFFTMEYVHGQDVRSIRTAARKRNEMIPLAISLAIVQGTAAALQCAHQMQGADGRPLGLVHRDVSASNVIVSYDGAIKLLDFGIARGNDQRHKTQTGTLKGKAPYMSPEQCRGQRLDRRTDLFSLGVVMFELTLGRRPFRGENDFTIMEQIVHGKAPLPSSIVAGYPPELEAIVMKLLARDPGARYATAEAMLQDLESFVAQHEVWVSSNSVGKYMRAVFADRVDAWERAADDGVSLGQHVAATSISQSHDSRPVVSSTAFPGLPAAGTPSAELAAVRPRISQPLPAVAEPSSLSEVSSPGEPSKVSAVSSPGEPSKVSAVSSPGEPSKVSAAYPELRSSRRVVVAVLAGLLVGGGGIAGFSVWQLQHKPVRPAAPEAVPPAAPEAVPHAAPEPVPPAATEPSSAAAAAANAEPAAATQPPPAEPRVELGPATLEPAPDPEPSITVTVPARTPEVKPPPKRVVPAKLPTRISPKKSDKEKEWDPDSPFLPPS